MRIALFCHSLRSDWNHGNAHFLRGVVTELALQGHTVEIFEPEHSWSYQNLIANEQRDYGDELRATYPLLRINVYREDTLNLDRAAGDADVVLVHEWTEPAMLRRLTAHRKRQRYLLLFHDTHHRSVSDPAMPETEGFDGVLAFGESVSERYRKAGWMGRVWTWHEAADIRVFYPRLPQNAVQDLLWIGNWGDGERTEELREFFIDPVKELKLTARACGVRYPPEALALISRAGIEFGGWIPNFRAPLLYAEAKLTVHIPRRPYTRELPGIPTIRVFEALACGIPLISAPWDDCEGLFTGGEDFLIARDKCHMKKLIRMLLADPDGASALADHGRATILERHTCKHRVAEFLQIYRQLRGASEPKSLVEAMV